MGRSAPPTKEVPLGKKTPSPPPKKGRGGPPIKLVGKEFRGFFKFLPQFLPIP